MIGSHTGNNKSLYVYIKWFVPGYINATCMFMDNTTILVVTYKQHEHYWIIKFFYWGWKYLKILQTRLHSNSHKFDVFSLSSYSDIAFACITLPSKVTFTVIPTRPLHLSQTIHPLRLRHLRSVAQSRVFCCVNVVAFQSHSRCSWLSRLTHNGGMRLNS